MSEFVSCFGWESQGFYSSNNAFFLKVVQVWHLYTEAGLLVRVLGCACAAFSTAACCISAQLQRRPLQCRPLQCKPLHRQGLQSPKA